MLVVEHRAARVTMLVVEHRGLIHETDLRAKLRPNPEVRNYRRKVAIHESGQREVAT